MRFIKFNEKQLDKLSEIASDIALIALASVVLPAVFDRFDIIRVSLGLLSSILLWMISLWLRK